MKVLQINSVCGIGSTGRIATEIHNMLIEQGHESYIAYGRDLPKNCDNPIRIGSRYDNYVHVAMTRLFDKHGFISNKATQMFIKEVEKINPDIIHLHNIHGYYINIEVLFNYLKKAKKHVVWTLHDCWAFTGHCAYFDYVGCEKWKTGCFKCSENKSYPSSFVFDNSRSNYAKKKDLFTGLNNLTIVTPSKWLAKLVEESYLKEYPIEVINNGIDLNTFKPTVKKFRKKYNLNDKFIILGVASVWERRKGLNYFIELSDKLNDDEVIVLVGLSEKQLKKMPKRIVGISRTNDVNELVDIYSSADVFLNPTLEDNFPTTNLEAMACGTPVITFNTGGSIESIDDSCGFIVRKNDINQVLSRCRSIKNGNSSIVSNNIILRTNVLYGKSEKFKEYLSLYEFCLKD